MINAPAQPSGPLDERTTLAARGLILRISLVALAIAVCIAFLLDYARQHLMLESARWNRFGAIVQAELAASACVTSILGGDTSSCLQYRTPSGQRVSVPWLLVLDLDGKVLGKAGDLSSFKPMSLEQILAPIIAGMRHPDGKLVPEASVARPIKVLSDDQQTVFAVAVDVRGQFPRILVGSVITKPIQTHRQPLTGLLLIVLPGMLISLLWLRHLFGRTVSAPYARLSMLLESGLAIPQISSAASRLEPLRLPEHPIDHFIALAHVAEQQCQARESLLQARFAEVSAHTDTNDSRVKATPL